MLHAKREMSALKLLHDINPASCVVQSLLRVKLLLLEIMLFCAQSGGSYKT